MAAVKNLYNIRELFAKNIRHGNLSETKSKTTITMYCLLGIILQNLQ